ncbi:hypothetical protein BGX29_010678 [Mortierella sp. GBA35]|nr:hypothetical protein BGX29_010678 [Mortierella sp. GBA35]KAF9092744.1 hypothetical protein BGX23_003959 [Mortierella sp. AD031]KAG0218893.1 hypothetical protein BGX33_005634 [Mortierella sp. NVP41]
MSLTAACCNTPAVQNAHWHRKGEQVALSTAIAGEQRTTYRTGPKDSKRGIVAIYDIFGYHPTTYQFFDRIAESHGGFQLSAPNFFTEGGINPELMGDGKKVMGWIGQHGDFEKNHIKEIVLAAVEDLRKAGCTTFSLIGQCWGVLMAAKVVSEDDGAFFLAAGGPHPSFISLETTKDVKVPLILLPSKDESDLVPVIEHNNTKGFPVESFHQRFDNMHHGWTGGRGDWEVPEQFKAGLEAVDLFGSYFAKVAAVHDSKL